MKFSTQKLSKRFPEFEASIFLIHEPYRMPGAGDVLSNAHRGTAAAIILPDGRYWVGVALCSPMDPFVKATGRAKAIGRAYKSMRNEGYLNEYGKLDLADTGTTPEGRHYIDDLKFSLEFVIKEAKKKVIHLSSRVA